MAADRPDNRVWVAFSRWLPVAALGVLLAVGSSCTLVKIMVSVSFPKPKQKIAVDSYSVGAPAATGRFRAGVGATDLTPPPGFPTGGHGPAGTVAFGYWTRLHARAFAFQDPDGRALVLVSCELFALPAGLEAKVGEHVAHQWGERFRLEPEELIVSATHTHHGPGNYMTSETYNAFGSSYSGFSRDLFDFLTARVEAAVDAAIENALAETAELRLVVHTSRLPERLLRNRSPRTFLFNQTAYSMMNALQSAIPACENKWLDGEPRDGWDLDGCPRLRAVDSGVTLLEVRRSADAAAPPLGVLTFFASHPTVLEPSSPLYGTDFAGVAMLQLEQALSRGDAHPVAGFFNGAEGDITPRRTRRDAADVLKLGALLGDALLQTVQNAGTPIEGASIRIRARRATIHPHEDRERTCVSDSGQATAPISALPTVGTAALGGAEDDRTLLYQLGWKEGVRDRRVDEQGPKQPALDSQLVRAVALTKAFAPPETFPFFLPITYAELGSFAVAAVPFEMSTAQGLDIRKVLGAGHGRLELIGLAGEYSGYVATAAEYDAQDYMAASTIWGPATGSLITCALGNLRAGLGETTPARTVEGETFNAGPKPEEPFGPAFLGGPRGRADQELEKVLQTKWGAPQHGLPWFVWEEPLRPDAGPEFTATGNRRVEVRSVGGAGTVDDDRGANLVTVLLAPRADESGTHRRWAAIWIAPLSPNPPTGQFYFLVQPPDAAGAGGGAPICSEPFDVASDLPETSPAVPPHSCP